jgi:hypothetical protein
MRRLIAPAILPLLACAAASSGAALPEEYLRSIEPPSEVRTVDGEGESNAVTVGIPSLFDFPLVRIIDANGDRTPDLLILGEDIRIVLVRTDTSDADSRDAGPGGELRDCGEGNGACSPGDCRCGIASIITSAMRSLVRVDAGI